MTYHFPKKILGSLISLTDKRLRKSYNDLRKNLTKFRKLGPWITYGRPDNPCTLAPWLHLPKFDFLPLSWPGKGGLSDPLSCLLFEIGKRCTWHTGSAFKSQLYRIAHHCMPCCCHTFEININSRVFLVWVICYDTELIRVVESLVAVACSFACCCLLTGWRQFWAVI